MMGGRKMPPIPVALSLLTTFLSGILMLGVPAEMFERGAQIWLNFVIGAVSSVFGLTTTLYTTIGGLKAVVWTDSLQYNSLWINIFSGIVTWLASFGVNQLAVQRYCSLPSIDDANHIIYCTLLPFICLCSTVSFVGFIALKYFYYCNPLETGQLKDMDHLIIMFAKEVCISVMGAMSGPFVGIFVLAMFWPRAGFMATFVSFIISNIAMIAICFMNYFEDPFRENFISTNSTLEGCNGLNVTIRQQPSYDAHFGNPNTTYIARLSTYAYSGIGMLIMLAIGVPITYFYCDLDPSRIMHLTYYGRQ
uniref:Uncharacterized protein n=1 Tax=Parascaris equorum TaxID=6256 RepID=A0A914SDA0_PAREQ